jgi:hypothetical protein
MLFELHNINLKLCNKQYNKIDPLHLIVVPQLSGGWQHNYSTQKRQAVCANEQFIYSLMSYDLHTKVLKRDKPFDRLGLVHLLSSLI